MSAKVDYRKGAACGQDNCKSKLYYEENGLTYCKRGHQQEGVQTQQDDDERNTQGRKTRIRRESQEKTSLIYRGETAVLLLLQSYQHILRKQCYALINTIGLPAQLERVVKYLWALRFQLLIGKVDASSEETVFSSQPVSETETESEGEGIGRKWKTRGKALPTLMETLGLLYFGTVLLHLPVSMGDIHRWAVREDIPYIRAVRFIPNVIKQKMPAEYLMALDTTTPLKPDHVRKTIHNLGLFYAHHFTFVPPPINAALLLYKHIRNLAIPITLHQTTLSLAKLLNISFTFPLPTQRQRTSSLPELTLISLLVIATKLYHPFNNDTHPRHARSPSDPAALAIDWPVWIKAHKAHKAHEARPNPEDHLTRGCEINVTEADVMEMTGEKLDEYMDYYERTFIDEERAETKSRGLPKQLLDMFPTGRIDGSTPPPYSYDEHAKKEQESTKTLLKAVVSNLKVRPITSTEEDDKETVPRIGSFYKRYRRVEDLDETARFFHDKVAEAVGIKLETLLTAVGQMEMSLINWRKAQLKKSGNQDGSSIF